MVSFRNNTSFHQDLAMLKSVNSIDPYSKLKQINQLYKKKNSQNQLNIPACEKSRSAVIDVIILIAVVAAFAVLLYPYGKLLVQTTAEIFEEAAFVFKDEIVHAPIIYGCFGISILFAFLSLLAVITLYVTRTCGKPGCQGLRKAAEFDIQLETEECVKNLTGGVSNSKNGFFQLPRDHHRELEAELKKMAPPNGRAVLVFRARCGCSIGRLEVPGSKKARKFKK